MAAVYRKWYEFVMRWVACICIMAALGSCKEELAFIPGTGTLPDCNDTPVTDLNGTLWFNQGPVTILTEGCRDYVPDDTLSSCAENWAFEQGACWYEDDDGDDMGIQKEGNVLTVDPAEQTMTGQLVLQGSCRVDYDATLQPLRSPSF